MAPAFFKSPASLLIAALALALVPDGAAAESVAAFQAPPPNPPVLVREAPASPPVSTRRGVALAAPVPYSIGDPTDEEQLYVEYINRARSDPAAEAGRLATTTDPDVVDAMEQFGVDRALMRSQFQAFVPAPPLSIHPSLTQAARRHTQDMFQNQFQGHTGTDGSSADRRFADAGYVYARLGENVFSTAHGVWHGHAGFNVDWGFGPGGMQTPAGHRANIHGADFREIGVGVVVGVNGKSGPQVVTQEFGSRHEPTPFVTGVVYYDFNGNQFYDLGEGIGGVTVRVSGTDAYAVTARSGGYSVPVAGNGTYAVTFQIGGLADVQRAATVVGGANVKVDHVPVYSAPVLGGSSVAYVGRNNVYLFSPVGAATGHEWRSLQRTGWTTPEGAESGLGRFEAETSAGYNPVSTSVRQSGVASYHMAHPEPPGDQYLRMRQSVRLGANSEWSFWSRLGLASTAQIARAQVSTDGGLNWEDVWAQAGSGGQGERGFVSRTVSLSAFAGRIVDLRFAYTFESGSYFPQTGDGQGWFIDDIRVSNSELLDGEAIASVLDGNSLAFRPASTGAYLLQVRALIGDRKLPWGASLALVAEEGGPVPPQIRVTSLARIGEGRWEVLFRVEEGTAASFEIHTAPAVTDPWVKEGAATIEPAGNPGTYRAVLSTGDVGARFFRVLGR